MTHGKDEPMVPLNTQTMPHCVSHGLHFSFFSKLYIHTVGLIHYSLTQKLICNLILE